MSRIGNRIASMLLAGAVVATTLLSNIAVLPAQAAANGNTYNYAVQLYGIGQDTLENGTAGLTFGPAIGADWSLTKMPDDHAPSGTTSAGHAYRCIITDYNSNDWSTIIAWNNLDPEVYTDCINHQCTITVRMALTDENSATNNSDPSKVFHSKVGESTGNGSGVYYGEVQQLQRVYATSQNAAVNWANSNVRAMLNGYSGLTYAKDCYSEENSFLSAFPEELQDAIGAKAVQYAHSYTDKTIETVYDKLWLFSAHEIYGGAEAAQYNYSEGTQYTRTKGLSPSDANSVKAYNYVHTNPDGTAWTWLRTLNTASGRATVAFSAGNGGPLNRNTVSGSSVGIAPGFVLRRDTSDVKVTVVFQQARGGAEAPDSVDVQLQRKAGDDYVDEGSATTITRDAGGQYTHTFSAADGFDWKVIAAGEVEGYNEPTVSGNAQDGYTITYSQDTTEVEAQVAFDLSGESEPDELTIALLDGDGNVVDTQVVSAENNWSYTWSDLTTGTYTIEIQDVPAGYETSLEVKDGVYILTYRKTPVTPPEDDSKKKAADGYICHHDYEWEVYRKATALEDGIMRYRCRYCGDVEYEVPMAAYYVFNKETQESIRDAAPNATVHVSTPIFISFHEMVPDALQKRPDVTLVVEYRYDGDVYEMTIPAGSGDTLAQLFGKSQYAGFLYLGGAFSTVMK